MISGGLSPNRLRQFIEFCLSADPAPKTHHITRLRMYKSLEGIFKEFDDKQKRCLSISGSVPLIRHMGLKAARVDDAQYPDYNILNLSFDDGEFDFCASDQVMEHVEGNPFDAVKESVRVLRDDGLVVHTTCFINPVHFGPKDLWRFSPEGLEVLVKSAGCEVELSGGWGNREAWAYMGLGFRKRGIPNNEENPIYRLAMENDTSVPITTWVVARKGKRTGFLDSSPATEVKHNDSDESDGGAA